MICARSFPSARGVPCSNFGPAPARAPPAPGACRDILGPLRAGRLHQPLGGNQLWRTLPAHRRVRGVLAAASEPLFDASLGWVRTNGVVRISTRVKPLLAWLDEQKMDVDRIVQSWPMRDNQAVLTRALLDSLLQVKH